jgi:23S rRNA (pseudouridine1915-N3)-methyltransferase
MLLNKPISTMKRQIIVQSSVASWLLLIVATTIIGIDSGVIIMPTTHAFSSSFLPSHQSITITHQHQRHNHSSSNLYMGLQIKIRIVGRKNGGEKWLDQSYSTYETRLKPTNLEVTTHWHKNDEELLKNIESDESKNHKVILLDPLGKMCTSEVFSENMYNWLEIGGSRLTFCIGGAEGLPNELRDATNKSDMLSLSSLTFTHQFARILLMEQIYRASEIRRGSGYHK